VTVKDITYLNNKCIFELYRTKDLRLAHVLREKNRMLHYALVSRIALAIRKTTRANNYQTDWREYNGIQLTRLLIRH